MSVTRVSVKDSQLIEFLDDLRVYDGEYPSMARNGPLAAQRIKELRDSLEMVAQLVKESSPLDRREILGEIERVLEGR